MVQNYEIDCTDDATTTGVIEKRGCPFGMIYNESASERTIYWYAARTKTGTPGIVRDQDKVEAQQTIPAGEAQAVHDAIAGCSYAFPKVDVDVTLYFEFTRYPS